MKSQVNPFGFVCGGPRLAKGQTDFFLLASNISIPKFITFAMFQTGSNYKLMPNKGNKEKHLKQERNKKHNKKTFCSYFVPCFLFNSHNILIL